MSLCYDILTLVGKQLTEIRAKQQHTRHMAGIIQHIGSDLGMCHDCEPYSYCDEQVAEALWDAMEGAGVPEGSVYRWAFTTC